MSMSNTVATDSTVQLRDGRTLGIASVGPSDGFPIFHCHGSGSSRLEVNLLAAAASEQGVRLIGPASDARTRKPTIGCSTGLMM